MFEEQINVVIRCYTITSCEWYNSLKAQNVMGNIADRIANGVYYKWKF